MTNNTESLESLKTFLRIPSISADPTHKPTSALQPNSAQNELRQAGMSGLWVGSALMLGMRRKVFRLSRDSVLFVISGTI